MAQALVKTWTNPDACRASQGKPVLTAVFRAFGPELAELPLIATQAAERRKGHCKVFMGVLQKLLAETGVKCLSLPAAHSTVRASRAPRGCHIGLMPPTLFCIVPPPILASMNPAAPQEATRAASPIHLVGAVLQKLGWVLRHGCRLSCAGRHLD